MWVLSSQYPHQQLSLSVYLVIAIQVGVSLIFYRFIGLSKVKREENASRRENSMKCLGRSTGYMRGNVADEKESE